MSDRFRLTPEIAPKNIPLSPSAVLSPRIQWHLALAVNGEILIVFPRATPFAVIDALAEKYGGEVYKVQAKISYEILTVNEYYDHSPRISL